MDKNQLLKEQIVLMSGTNPRKCMKCGKCSASCPAYDEMEYHPHQFVSMVERGDLEPLMKSKSLYRCLSCFACVDRCPRNVEPTKLIEAVRTEALRRQTGNQIQPEDVPQMLDENMPQQILVTMFRKLTD